jgi:hypothetical protein
MSRFNRSHTLDPKTKRLRSTEIFAGEAKKSRLIAFIQKDSDDNKNWHGYIRHKYSKGSRIWQKIFSDFKYASVLTDTLKHLEKENVA